MPDTPFQVNAQESSEGMTTTTPPSQITPTTYEGDVNHVIEGTGKPPKKNSKIIVKIILFFIVICVVSGLTGGFIILKNYRNDPLRLIAKSFEHIESTSSFTAHATFPEIENYGLIDLNFDYQKAPYLFSRGQAKITNINSEMDHNLSILAIFNSTDSYLQAMYSKIDSLESQLNLIYPEIQSLETYQLILPVIKGQKWVHLTVNPEQPSQEGVQISEEKQKEINQKFIDSIIVRSHETNYKFGDNLYQRIVLGFDEQKLIDFVESFKSLDLEIKLAQINSLIKIIQSADNWNDDTIEILIEKDTGNLYSLSLSLPKFPEDSLEQTIEENLQSENSISTLTELFSNKLKDIVKPENTGKLIYIGRVEITNYNQAPSAQIPSPLVEQNEIKSAIEHELPLLLQVMFMTPEEDRLDSDLYIPDYLNQKTYDVLSATISSLKK